MGQVQDMYVCVCDVVLKQKQERRVGVVSQHNTTHHTSHIADRIVWGIGRPTL